MQNLNVDVRLAYDNAKIPTQSHPCDAGWDFYVVRDEKFFTPTKFSSYYKEYAERYIYVLNPMKAHLFDTGVRLQIPPSWCMVLFDRSGLGAKKLVHRTAGVVDSGYLDNTRVSLVNLSENPVVIAEGDRIIQGLFLPVPEVNFEIVDQLSETHRGLNGFGSTGQ